MAVLMITTFFDPYDNADRMSLFYRLDPHRLFGDDRVQWVWAYRLEARWRRSRN